MPFLPFEVLRSPLADAPSSLPSLEQILAHLADAAYLIEPETSRIIWCNRAGWENLGLTREEVLNQSVLSLQRDVTGQAQWADIAAAIRSTACFNFVGRHRHKAGHEIAVEVNTTHFAHEGQEYFLSTARDITRRLALEATLRDRESQLWFALNEAMDGLWDWDVGTGTLFFSPQLKRMLGYGPDEMAPILDTWRNNVHPEDLERVMAILLAHMAGKRARYEADYRLRNSNGHYIWVHDRGQVCERDADGQPTRVVGMVQDISERKQLEFQLHELASNDALTQLPNRRQGMRFFESQLELCRRLNLPLGLCFLDIDHFKSINDTYGHLAGDRILQQVAGAIAGAIRRSDMVCRWGGEEFIIVSPSAAPKEMRLVAEKVRAVLQTIRADGPAAGLTVTASVGFACFPRHANQAGKLLEMADLALYRAKQAGRNRVEEAPIPTDRTPPSA